MSVIQSLSLAERVRGITENLLRPNCLNFKIKSNLRRNEIIDLLKSMNFVKSKLIGIEEMKGQSIDTTCKNRESDLELFEMLRKVDSSYNLALYVTENVNIRIGWVPIPMTNETIRKHIESHYGKVVNIFDKQHKYGLRSAMRILTMKKDQMALKPIPSYS